jgi:protein-tyrosine-phosphatase
VTSVLFVCVANSGRSVMAERLFRQLAGERHQARSARNEPGAAPRPQVVEALREIGIDLSTCSEEVCPVTPGVRRVNLGWASSAVRGCSPRTNW